MSFRENPTNTGKKSQRRRRSSEGRCVTLSVTQTNISRPRLSELNPGTANPRDQTGQKSDIQRRLKASDLDGKVVAGVGFPKKGTRMAGFREIVSELASYLIATPREGDCYREACG